MLHRRLYTEWIEALSLVVLKAEFKDFLQLACKDSKTEGIMTARDTHSESDFLWRRIPNDIPYACSLLEILSAV